MAKPKLLVASLIGALALTSIYGLSVVVEQKDQMISQLQQGVSEALDGQAELQQRLALLSLEQDSKVAELARLEQEVAQLTDENLSLKQELMVYRQIMAPEQQAGGMKIEQLHIEPMLSPGYYRIDVLLMQVARNKRWLQGELKVQLVGSQDGQPSSYNVADLQQPASELTFKFRYFQELSSEIKLPEGFQVERVELSAFIKGNKWNKAAQIDLQQAWPDLGNT